MTTHSDLLYSGAMTTTDAIDTKFHHLLSDQVRSELGASQQYLAVAVYFDSSDLPQLAKLFYRQSIEERNHALMLVQYLIDRDVDVEIPGVDSVRNAFATPRDALALALEQERTVTEQVSRLAGVARDEGDYLGEQFMQWFLKEQVEEVAQMTTLLNVMRRANGNLFDVENFLARESVGTDGADPLAPHTAGGSV